MGWVWEEGCEGHVTASESAEERTTLAGGSCQFYDQRSLQYQHCGLAGMRQESLQTGSAALMRRILLR
jgi:hypothetical protein